MGAAANSAEWQPLAVQAPVHLEATVRVLQRRPSNPVDVWEQGRYRRVLRIADRLVPAEVMNRGTVDQPDIRFAIRSPAATAARAEVGCTLRKMLSLDLDPHALQAAAMRERALCPTAVALRGMRPPRFPTLFEAFGNVIPFQQLSIDAGVAIVTRLVLRFGERLQHDGQRMVAFPSAATIAHARLASLRACGLSGTKATVLRELARMIEAGGLDEAAIARMSTADALRMLIELPGIGPWSAALVLLRGFGRLDVFPPGDVGAIRELCALLRLRSHTSLDRVQARFGKLRGYLYFFGIGANLLARELIHPAPGAAAGSKTLQGASEARVAAMECAGTNG
jgi:DNA-3-methyladenine glycosylase II